LRNCQIAVLEHSINIIRRNIGIINRGM